MTATNKIYVYNLEFPMNCDNFNVYGYKFEKVKNYDENFSKLQNLFCPYKSKINLNPCGNTITGIVEPLLKEKTSILYQESKTPSALFDILLLLSIFTRREVFTRKNLISSADQRQYFLGALLRDSLPKDLLRIEKENGFFSKDIGLEIGINQVYKLIRTKAWRKKYKNGYFLLLANAAFKDQIIESMFISCWTILEHIFTLHNENWLSDEAIRKLSPAEKITFLIHEYITKLKMNNRIKEKVKKLVRIRNRLIHYGKFPNDQYDKDSLLIITMTEYIITKILGLTPTDVYHVKKKLEKYLGIKT